MLFFAEIDELPQTKIYVKERSASHKRVGDRYTLYVEHYCLHCEIISGVHTKKNVNDYNNIRPEIRLFVLELFNCLCSEVRKCK